MRDSSPKREQLGKISKAHRGSGYGLKNLIGLEMFQCCRICHPLRKSRRLACGWSSCRIYHGRGMPSWRLDVVGGG